MLNLKKELIRNIKKFLDEIKISRPESEKAGLLYAMFRLDQKLRYSDIKDLIGRQITTDFLKTGLFTKKGNIVTTLFDMHLYEKMYFFYDKQDKDDLNLVYFGQDSEILAAYLPKKASKVLDLCTGSGIHAITMAKRAEYVNAVDINPKAVNTAKFNMMLNDIENMTVLEGNLYGPVKGKFDLIIANPPLIPVPANCSYPLCGNGGEDGLFILKKIIAGLKIHLSPQGQAIILGAGTGNDAPFVKDFLDKNFKLIVLDKVPKDIEISNRASLLSRYNTKNCTEDMERIYKDADYFYKYIIKVKN